MTVDLESDTESDSSPIRSPSPPWLLQDNLSPEMTSTHECPSDSDVSQSPSPEWILQPDDAETGAQPTSEPMPPSTPYSRLFNGSIFVEKYPDSRAGAPISDKKQHSTNDSYKNKLKSGENIFRPFAHETDWLVARWAKNRGPGSTATTELLSIPSVCLLTLCSRLLNSNIK